MIAPAMIGPSTAPVPLTRSDVPLAPIACPAPPGRGCATATASTARTSDPRARTSSAGQQRCPRGSRRATRPSTRQRRQRRRSHPDGEGGPTPIRSAIGRPTPPVTAVRGTRQSSPDRTRHGWRTRRSDRTGCRATRRRRRCPTIPVGAVRKNSRTFIVGDTRTGGASVVAASANGTNDIDTRIDATTNSVASSGSPVAMRSCPSPRPPIEAIMYTASVRPRVRGVEASFSHDSTTTYSPAMQNPNTNRNTPQLNGFTQTKCMSTTHDASDARLANTRMWPTPDSHRTTRTGPSRKPAK